VLGHDAVVEAAGDGSHSAVEQCLPVLPKMRQVVVEFGDRQPQLRGIVEHGDVQVLARDRKSCPGASAGITGHNGVLEPECAATLECPLQGAISVPSAWLVEVGGNSRT